MTDEVASELDALPADVRDLLVTTVDSLEKLEVLLHAAREPARTWTIVELAEARGLGRGDAALAVGALAQDGLLVRVGDGHRLAQYSSRRTAVTALLALCDADRGFVLRAMSEAALERVRSSATIAFLHARLAAARPAGGGDGEGGDESR